MRRTKRVLAIVALTALVGCSNSEPPYSTPTMAAVTLRLYATTATGVLLDDLAHEYSDLHPGFTFETGIGNNRRMIEHLLNGDMPYYLTNYLAADSALWAAPIGQDGIAVIVHPSNPAVSLTSGQLRAIYQGRLSNWREIGGPDSRIMVISREAGSGTRAAFENLVMGARRTTQAAQLVPSSEAMLEAIASLPGGIGYVSVSCVDPTTHTLAVDGVAPTLENIANNTYPLRATLFVVGREEPEDHYRAFIGWMQSPQGQAIVSRHYAPLLHVP
jgi:phosphate transport system substrate-binding protein